MLAEVDYLKPYFDAHPQDRADLLAFIAAGRVEIVGGTYNEPNTNLTCAETTIRNVVYGMGFQRDVLGADPRHAWMLDVFGHDPAYPGLMAAAGLTESSWARGPFHQWGPERTGGGNTADAVPHRVRVALARRQRPAHQLHAEPLRGGLGDAARGRPADRRAGRLRAVPPADAGRRHPQRAAAGRHRPRRPVQLGDRDPPGLERRYVWPRFVTAVPSEFFAAVRAEQAATRRAGSCRRPGT